MKVVADDLHVGPAFVHDEWAAAEHRYFSEARSTSPALVVNVRERCLLRSLVRSSFRS
jgi:hypothetical protein